MAENFDVVVIGSGPGGYVAAIRSAQLGLKTACIEKDPTLGGTCLNVGCIPSKALLHSTELLYTFEKEAQIHGVIASDVKVDFPQMMTRKQKVVSGFTKGIEFLFQKNKIKKYQATATLVDEHTIQMENESIQAKNIILATGSQPIALPFLPFDEKVVLSSTGALALTKVPQKMLIIGAGIIGVEMGSVYSRLGSEVIFIEALKGVCPPLDQALSAQLEKILVRQNMQFYFDHKVVSAEVSGKGVLLKAEGANGVKEFSSDVVLVAIGRKPYSDNLGLEKVGIEKDAKGFVKIDSFFRTKVPHIYAIGDLVDGPMLAHKASEEGVAVAELISGKKPVIEYIAIPNVAYTHPEVASVGLTEQKVKEMGLEYQTGSFPFKANSRARCTAEEDGFVKIIIHKKSKKLLGIHILGAHASELIGEATVAIQQKMTAEQLGDVCHAHPTLSEAIKEAALMVSKGAIHT